MVTPLLCSVRHFIIFIISCFAECFSLLFQHACFFVETIITKGRNAIHRFRLTESLHFCKIRVKISKIRKNSMCPNGMLMKRESDSLPRRPTIACQGKLSGSLHLRSLSSQSEFNQYHFAFLYESKIWFGAYPSYIGSKSLASCPQSGHV